MRLLAALGLGLGLAMPLAATPAAAADWYMTGEAASASSASFIDKDSIRRVGDMVQARFYMVYIENESDGTASLEALMEYDCAQRRSRFLRLATFDDRQAMLSDDPGSGRWSPVNAGTQEEPTMAFACSNGQSRTASPSLGADRPFVSGRAHLVRHRTEDAQPRPAT